MYSGLMLDKKLRAEEVIEMLGLVGLEPEGGFFKRTYPPPYQSPIASAIYYLLKDDDISAMHCLNADEIYHFYDGD
ncbi:MAG: cupin domain-containing protein, partial [Deinococcales bacterium]